MTGLRLREFHFQIGERRKREEMDDRVKKVRFIHPCTEHTYSTLCFSPALCLYFFLLYFLPCFRSSPLLLFSLDVSVFVILTAFLLLCQCDRGRCKAVPVGSVHKTVHCVLAGTEYRECAGCKEITFLCMCVFASVRCVFTCICLCI